MKHETDVQSNRSDANLPAWIKELTSDELNFVERFVLCSGSLKALAKDYGVSYPTLRNRLDGLIMKMREVKTETDDSPVKAKVRQLLRDGLISVDAARQIVSVYERESE